MDRQFEYQLRPGETRLMWESEIHMCGICGSYSPVPHHSHECRDCGADIDCHGVENSYSVCMRWDGGNDACPVCHGER